MLARAAAGRRGPVKAFLMDAGVVVGVGNIYASETLHRAGVHPEPVGRPHLPAALGAGGRVGDGGAPAGDLPGGTTLNDFADGEGRSGYFQVSLTVYDREGEPCLACGRPVRRIVQAGRSTFYCPGCQR